MTWKDDYLKIYAEFSIARRGMHIKHNRFHISWSRALPAPFNKFVQLFTLPFCFQINTAIRAIFYKSRNAPSASLTNCTPPEADSLYTARDPDFIENFLFRHTCKF